MKSKYLFSIFVLFSVSISLSAQNEKRRFFIETGVKVFGGGDYINYIGKTGISFNQQSWATYKEDGSLWQEDSYNSFSWSIAPRIGYCLGNRLKAGVEYQHYQVSFSGYVYNNNSSGVFLRLDFNDKKIVPFIELASGFGVSKNVEDRISPGAAEYQTIERLKLFYYSGSAGVTFVLSDNFNLNLSARIHKTLVTEIDDDDDSTISYITVKEQGLEIGPMLSVSYFFNKKSTQ